MHLAAGNLLVDELGLIGLVEFVARLGRQTIAVQNVEQARQPMFTTGDDTRSGMGFTIMETFTDKMRVRSTPGKGTLVAMVKVLKERQA